MKEVIKILKNKFNIVSPIEPTIDIDCHTYAEYKMFKENYFKYLKQKRSYLKLLLKLAP